MNTSIDKERSEKGLVESYKEIKSRQEDEKIILPFEVKPGETYTVEDLGEIDGKPFFSFFKRLSDFVISLIGLIVLFIPIVILAVGVKFSSKGSVFYKQERLGLNGKKFNIVKFRTMYVDSEKDGARWSEGDADERITGFGRFLRKSHLDEVPQLFCCLIGTMSLVGPRPERECFYNEFEKYIFGFHQRLKVKPGLTGLAQVNGGYDLPPQEKVLYDVEYIKKRTLWLDFKILLKTVRVVFSRKGVK